MGLVQTIPPTAYPVDHVDVANYLRLDEFDDLSDNNELPALIGAATEYLQNETNQQFVDAGYRLTLHRFPLGCELGLPKPPLHSVESIMYIDPDGDTQVLPSGIYSVDTTCRPGCIIHNPGESWPATAQRHDAVQVNFTAGYGEPDDVPFAIRQAVNMLVGHYMENREASSYYDAKQVPFAVESIINQHRYPEVV